MRGTNGIVHRRKVRNKFLDITDTPPIDGADIVTTIDVSMQDLAERSLACCRFNDNLLETALQGSVLLNALAILIERGGTDTLDDIAGKKDCRPTDHKGICGRKAEKYI